MIPNEINPESSNFPLIPKPSAFDELCLARSGELMRVKDIFADSGLTVTRQALHRHVNGGPAMIDAISLGDDASEIAHALIITLKREGEQRQLLTQPLVGREGHPTGVSCYGAPALSDPALGH
jgi:hypothetical protein